MNTPSQARSSGDIASRSLPLKVDRAAGDFVGRMAGQHAGERALARAVRAHDGVHLAGVHRQVEAFEDVFALGAHAEIFDVSSIVSCLQLRGAHARGSTKLPTFGFGARPLIRRSLPS